MKFGLLTYTNQYKKFNIGDYVQSLAAKQFLGNTNIFINRENASKYEGEAIKLIMNGWFTHTKTNSWIPSPKITPLFISFHANSGAIDTILNEKGLEYLKKYEPIGCRDYHTVHLLKARGINAYFSGCLTLTLDSYKKTNVERKGIYIVDPFYNYPSITSIPKRPHNFIKFIIEGNLLKLSKGQHHLKKIFDQDLLNKAETITQMIPNGSLTDLDKFNIADNLLKKYSTAELVITSRIHCALPCLAMGTPVIYLDGFDTIADSCRFEGIAELFNLVKVNSETGEFVTNFTFDGDKIGLDNMKKLQNKDDYSLLAEKMKKTCREFVNA